MTRLRKMMLEELQRRNYSQTTVKGYLKIVQGFAERFHQPPDQSGPEEIRNYQAYLLERMFTLSAEWFIDRKALSSNGVFVARAAFCA